MFILMIIGLLGFIFSLFIILYFTSKDIIGDPKDYDKLEDVISNKETHKEKD